MLHLTADDLRDLMAGSTINAMLENGDELDVSAEVEPEVKRLLDAGWWRATNAAGEEGWIDPGLPGWKHSRETALEAQGFREED